MCKSVKMVVMDVDGVLTDGKIILGTGIELKFFHVHDGYAIQKLKEYSMLPVIITGRESKCVDLRAKELGIEPSTETKSLYKRIAGKGPD